jgi:hypothetical protein
MTVLPFRAGTNNLTPPDGTQPLSTTASGERDPSITGGISLLQTNQNGRTQPLRQARTCANPTKM